MTDTSRRERRERVDREESFTDSSNGLGMIFEGLILHGVDFFCVQLTNMTCLTV